MTAVLLIHLLFAQEEILAHQVVSILPHHSSLFPLHLSLTANSPAEPSKDLHKRGAVPRAACFPAETSCMANQVDLLPFLWVLLQKLPWGLLCLLLQRFHVRRRGRECPPYAVTEPGATSSVNILLSGAQCYPAIFLSPCHVQAGAARVLWSFFSPRNLSSSELSLETLTLSCGLDHKTTSFQGKQMSTIVFSTHLFLGGFS